MAYYIKNPSGGISTVPKKLYDYLSGKDEYECWEEDKYKDVPEEVEGLQERSSDYTISELRGMDLGDKPDEFFEGDTRKTVERLR